jgi:soluble P-type ATPase
MAAWRGRNLGIIFQFFQLLPALSIIENVMLPMDFCNMYTPRERPERAMQLLAQVEMAEQAHKLPSAVSGGQQQRVAIARALANDPPVLIADEPTGNLDSKTTNAVFQLFENLVANGKTVVMYLVTVLAFGTLSLLVSVPLGVLGAWALANFFAGLFNFDITTIGVPPMVLALQVAAGLLVPLLAALAPVLTEGHDGAFQLQIAKAIEERLKQQKLELAATQTLTQLHESSSVGINLIVVFLLIMAVLLAVVGGLGLMGTMSINVLERTREIGVMRAIGAIDGAVLRIVMVEGILIGVLSWRITPQQKQRLVRSLRQQGHYVAMIGDGVNDVLSLKQANLAIAMQSGSQAARRR